MKKKKVLFITTIGGFLKQFEMNDVKILQEAGYEVHYASNFDNPIYEMSTKELEEKGIILHQIGIQKSPKCLVRNIQAYKTLEKLIEDENIEAVHCHNPMGGVVGRMLAMHFGNKLTVLYTAHGFHFYNGAPLMNWLFYYPVERYLANFTQGLITINSEDYIRAGKYLRKHNGKVAKIPGVGVDKERFAPVPGVREEMRKKLNIPDNVFYILSVGELNHNKNHIAILKAIAQIPEDNIYFGICGRGPARQELLQTAERLGLRDRFRLYGFRKDIPQMLAAADCFAFPSKREGLGIAAIEALAAGIPLITSDCRGTREYMNDGTNGFVCKSGNPSEYAAAIVKMKENPDIREQMSQKCLQMAAKFDIAVTDKIMREIYREVLHTNI